MGCFSPCPRCSLKGLLTYPDNFLGSLFPSFILLQGGLQPFNVLHHLFIVQGVKIHLNWHGGVFCPLSNGMGTVVPLFAVDLVIARGLPTIGVIRRIKEWKEYLDKLNFPNKKENSLNLGNGTKWCSRKYSMWTDNLRRRKFEVVGTYKATTLMLKSVDTLNVYLKFCILVAFIL